MPDFSSFDDDFTRTPPRPKYASEATAALPDGDYEVEVTAGLMKEDEHGPRVTILMVVTAGPDCVGWKIDKTTFLTKKSEGGGREKDQKRVDELKNDLATMGFDVANWKPPERPFAKQLAIACAVMKGVKLKVRKKQNGEYANLYLNKRLDDDKPKVFGPAEMVMPADGAAGQEQYGHSPLGGEPEKPSGEVIPF